MIVVVPFVRDVVDVTDSLDGLGVVPVPDIVLAPDCLRCGMRVGVCSSVICLLKLQIVNIAMEDGLSEKLIHTSTI